MTHSQPVLSLSPEEIEEIVAWARQAGQITLRHFKNVAVERKPDHTFLTQADLEVEQFLAERIRTTYPEHTLIGEEGTRDEHIQTSPNIWAIDPIDGTTVFAQGLTGWGITMGLLHEGQPHFGLFYMPLLDDLTYTTHTGEVYCNGQKLSGKLRLDWADKGFLATSSNAHYEFYIDVKRLRALGSISANLVYTARGVATATFSPKASLWDLVAGAAILTRLGGELRYLSGKPVDYLVLLDGQRAPEPVLAGHPQIVAELRGRIQARPD